MADDPFVLAAIAVLDQALDELRPCIEGASSELLNWRPAGDSTNSIAVLGVHALGSTRWWVCASVGAPMPARDRASEFVASATDAASLLGLIDEVAGDVRTALTGARDIDWSTAGKTQVIPDGQSPSYALLHALSHLREHVGQMSLTRQLWDAHGSSG